MIKLTSLTGFTSSAALPLCEGIAEVTAALPLQSSSYVFGPDAGLPSFPTAVSEHWAFEPVKAEKENPELPQCPMSPIAARLLELRHSGIQGAEDFDLLLDLLLKLRGEFAELQRELPAGFAVIERIAQAFRNNKIPIHFLPSGSTSHVKRNMVENRYRMERASVSEGVFIALKKPLETAIHEMAHAIPGNELLTVFHELYGEDLRVLVWPDFPSEQDDITSAFIKLLARGFQDEFYSGIAAKIAGGLFSGLEGRRPIKNMPLDSAGVVDYFQSGLYIGDNHLLVYNLFSAFSLFLQILDEPESLFRSSDRQNGKRLAQRAKQKVLGSTSDYRSYIDLINEGGIAEWRSEITRKLENAANNAQNGSAADLIDLLKTFSQEPFGRELLKNVRDVLCRIVKDKQSTHPLKPVAFYLLHGFFEIGFNKDKAVRRSFSKPLFLPLRGNPEWIAMHPEIADGVRSILETYVTFIESNAVGVKRYGNYRPFVPASLMLKTKDIPTFWRGLVDSIMSYDSSYENGAFPLVLPMIMHGYVTQARSFISAVRKEPLFYRSWTELVFSGLGVVTRIGESRPIDSWLDIVEEEVRAKWSFGYHSELLKIARANGELNARGEDVIARYFEEHRGTPVTPYEFVAKLFDLSKGGNKASYQAWTGPYGADDAIDHVDDFYDSWRGSEKVEAEFLMFLRELPRVYHLRMILDAVDRMRERGLAEHAQRAKSIMRHMLDSIISLRRDNIKFMIEKAYGDKRIKYRIKDSLPEHVQKLNMQELNFLPPPAELSSDAFFIAGLAPDMGGGWDAAIGYIDSIPDGFVKAMTLERIANELKYTDGPQPSSAQIARLMDIWNRVLQICIPLCETTFKFQPNEAWLLFGDVRSNADSIQDFVKKNIFSTNVAAVFKQRQHLAMLHMIPQTENGGFAEIRAALSDRFLRHKIVRPVLAPAIAVPFYNPDDNIGTSVLQRNLDPRKVFVLYSDLNLIPLEFETEDACASGDIDAISRVAERIEEALAVVSPEMKMEYIPLLIKLSISAGKLKLASNLYDFAYDLAKNFQKIDLRSFQKSFSYGALSLEQRQFDSEVRLRAKSALWESAMLERFARLATHDDTAHSEHYLAEIRRILDKESIFDVMKSRNYAEAARILDSDGRFAPLVFDLYQRAAWALIREQHEAGYDTDYKLAYDIDRSGLSHGDRDALLSELIAVNFQRQLRAFSNDTLSFGAEKFDYEICDRFALFLNRFLGIAAGRGYVRTENEFWRMLGRITDEKEDIPQSFYDSLLSMSALLAVAHHPEVGLTDTQFRTRLSSISKGLVEKRYSKLPTVAEIEAILRDGYKGGLAHEYDEKLDEYRILILESFPKNGSQPPSFLVELIKLISEGYFSSIIEAPEDEIEMRVLEVLDLLFLNHLGLPKSRKGEHAFILKYPDVFRRVMLTDLNNELIDKMGRYFRSIFIDKSLPIEVRKDAFRAYIKSSQMSPYLRAKFKEVEQDPNALSEFLDNMKRIIVKGNDDRRYVLPDWFVAPLFEPLLAEDKEHVLRALRRKKSYTDEELHDLTWYDDFEDWGAETNVTDNWSPYDTLIAFLLDENGEIIVNQLRIYQNNDASCMDTLRWLFREYLYKPMGKVEEKTISTFLRNQTIVRSVAVKLSLAMEKVHPTLRLVIANSVSHMVPARRVLLLNALRHTEETIGEDDVIRKYFDYTGMGKLAQFLSLQEGVVPETYRVKLEKFHEDLKPSTQQEITDTLRMNGIQLSSDSVLYFEHAGTVGELWSVKFADGRKMAIKILPWRKRRHNEESIQSLAKVADDLQRLRHELFGGIDFDSLYRRYRDTLILEMDYRREAENLHLLAPSMAGMNIKFPNIEEDSLRQDVMFMDHIQFRDIKEIDAAGRRRLVDQTGQWLAESIFERGVFYEDFHPGNIKWISEGDGSKGRPLILDFGRIGNLAHQQRQALMQFLVCIGFENVDDVVKCLKNMTTQCACDNETAFKSELKTIFSSGSAGSRRSHTLQKIFAAASKHGFELDPNFLQFMKAVQTWEKTMAIVDRSADFSTYAVPVILKELYGTKSE